MSQVSYTHYNMKVVLGCQGNTMLFALFIELQLPFSYIFNVGVKLRRLTHCNTDLIQLCEPV